MGISAVGTLTSGTGVTTLAVSPAAVGNALGLAIKLPSGTATVTAVTGGGCTWTRIAGPYVDTAGSPHTHYLYLGTVTATGSATITVSLSAGAADLDAQEFTNGSTSTTWAVDGTQAALVDNTATAATVKWPALTPSGSGELYVGHSRCPGGSGTYSAPTTGFTVQADADVNPYIYGTGVSAAVTPQCTSSTSTASYSIGALVTASLPAGTISGVGTVASVTGTSGVTRTLTVAPQAVGDAMVLSVEIVSSTAGVQSVTGGGCTTWTRLIQYVDSDSPSSHDELWLGTVTATGSATITVTGTSSLGTLQVDLDCQEFTASGYGASTVWAVDGSQAAGVTNPSSTTLTWPTLTPSGPGELYVGRGRVPGTAPASGTPASFTWQVDADVDPYAYGVVSAPVTPTQTISSGTSVAVAALLTAGNGITATGSLGLPAAGMSGTGSSGPPPPVTSSGSLALATAGMSGTATAANPVTASGLLALPAMTTAGTASNGISPAVAQQATASFYKNYGAAVSQVSTAAGNTLMLFAGWDTAATPANALVPAISVTDSAGNLWRQIGITPSSGYAARCAAWICPNAEAISWVSPCPTGYASSLAWNLVELSGMPGAVDVDFTVTTVSMTAGTAVSLSGVCSGDDVAFALVAATSPNLAAPSAPPGWAALDGVQAGGDSESAISVFPYWMTGASGILSPSWALAESVTYAALMCTIRSSAVPPAQGNENFPLVVTEAAFGAMPGDPSRSTDCTWDGSYTGWTDISERVIGPPGQARITATRGRQYELSQQEAGTLKCWLDNHDGAFTPGSTASPYYSNALNPNMAMEAGTFAWYSNNNATIAASDAHAYTGTYSLQVTPDGSTANPGARSAQVLINVNYPYSASAWIYVPGGWSGGAQAGINWFSASGGYIGTSSGTVTGAVAAGQWIQVTAADFTPPPGTAKATVWAQLVGTPPSSTVFYVDECAIVAGATTVATGLVRPSTPLRVTAWWEGRQYPVAFGYVERWPQEWPDLPQWGLSQVVACDAIAVASAATEFSAVQGDIILDAPYAYLPCAEMYTTATVGYTPASSFFLGTQPYYVPADANGLDAVNYATDNQLPGVYADGDHAEAETGMALNLLGDMGTGMGASGYTAEGTGQRGPSVLYYDQDIPGVPSGGALTVEFWFNLGTGADSVTLLSLYGAPSFYAVNPLTGRSGAGAALSNGCFYNIQYSSGFGMLVSGYAATGTMEGTQEIAPFTPDGNPHHVTVVFTPGLVTIWVDGTPSGPYNVTAPSSSVQAVLAGPGRYSYDCGNYYLYTSYNFAAGHLAIYPYQLSRDRIQAHYNSGSAGWAGVTAAYRFAQILTWGRLGLKRGVAWNEGGVNGEITKIGPAYDLAGSSAASAVNQLTQEEGGRSYTQANGSYIYMPRWAVYNQPVTATFGDAIDGSEIPYLKGSKFGYDNTDLYNAVQSTQQQGPSELLTVEMRDPAAERQYFRRSALTYTSEVQSPYDVSDRTTWSLARFSQPVMHVKGITVDAASRPGIFTKMLGLDISGITVVSRRPLGGAPISETGIVERIAVSIGPGLFRWQLQMSPYTPQGSVLMAGVSGQDEPGSAWLGW